MKWHLIERTPIPAEGKFFVGAWRFGPKKGRYWFYIRMESLGRVQPEKAYYTHWMEIPPFIERGPQD